MSTRRPMPATASAPDGSYGANSRTGVPRRRVVQVDAIRLRDQRLPAESRDRLTETAERRRVGGVQRAQACAGGAIEHVDGAGPGETGAVVVGIAGEDVGSDGGDRAVGDRGRGPGPTNLRSARPYEDRTGRTGHRPWRRAPGRRRRRPRRVRRSGIRSIAGVRARRWWRRRRRWFRRGRRRRTASRSPPDRRRPRGRHRSPSRRAPPGR